MRKFKTLLYVFVLAFTPLVIWGSSSSVDPAVVGNFIGFQGTAPASYTPTFTNFGSVVTHNFKTAKVGPFLYLYGKFTVVSVNGSVPTISLPSGMVVASSVATNQIVGDYSLDSASSGGFNVLVSGGGTTMSFSYDTGTGGSGTPAVGTTIAGAGSLVSINAWIPIEGFIVGGVASGKACGIEYTGNNGFGSTNTAVRRFLTKGDQRGPCDLTQSSTIGDKFIPPTGYEGTYTVHWHDTSVGGTGIIGIFKNGTNGAGNARTSTYAQGLKGLNSTGAANQSGQVSWTGYLGPTDYIWMQSSVSGLDGTGSGAQVGVSITRVGD